MIKIRTLYAFVFLVILCNCKKNSTEKKSTDKHKQELSFNKKIDTAHPIETLKRNSSSLIKQDTSEIYIGKTFYEQDELNDYLYKEGGSISADSLTVYTIYENDIELIYSLEKQISFEDLREYKIIDTITLKKAKFKNFISKQYPLKNNIILEVISKSNKNIVYKCNADLVKIRKI